MVTAIKKAVASTTATKNELHNEASLKTAPLSSLKMYIGRTRKIAERLSQIPKAYQGIYKKAVQGKSLRACVNAQCLECCGWLRKEITLCTALACPLYAVRPYQDGHSDAFSGAESKNSEDSVK